MLCDKILLQYLLHANNEDTPLNFIKFKNYLTNIVQTKHYSNPLFAVCLAVAIPLLDLFISLFGALCLSALGIAFPAIIELCVAHINRKLNALLILKDILLIIVGILGLVIGTYCSLIEIIKKMGTDNQPVVQNIITNSTAY